MQNLLFIAVKRSVFILGRSWFLEPKEFWLYCGAVFFRDLVDNFSDFDVNEKSNYSSEHSQAAVVKKPIKRKVYSVKIVELSIISTVNSAQSLKGQLKICWLVIDRKLTVTDLCSPSAQDFSNIDTVILLNY